VEIFIATVVGGLTSLPGAVIGAVVIGSLRLFGDRILDGLSTLATGAGILIILLFLPGGLGEGLYKVRDSFLRAVANRKGILVPSLVADRRVEERAAEAEIIEQAEAHVEEVERFDLAGAVTTITCPVCAEVLTLEAASEHPHLQGGDGGGAGAEAVVAGGGGRMARARAGRR
jgi:hypothetical protein